MKGTRFGRVMEQVEGDAAKSRFYNGIEVREVWDFQNQASDISITMLPIVTTRVTERGQMANLLKKLRERRDLLNEMISCGEQELANARKKDGKDAP